MEPVSRRSLMGGSLAALSAAQFHSSASAAPQCVTALLPPFLPMRLSVDCASKRNFQMFRQNSAYMGLTGVVSMSAVRGRYGSYPAGNLFLFPWLKAKGLD